MTDTGVPPHVERLVLALVAAAVNDDPDGTATLVLAMSPEERDEALVAFAADAATTLRAVARHTGGDARAVVAERLLELHDP